MNGEEIPNINGVEAKPSMLTPLKSKKNGSALSPRRLPSRVTRGPVREPVSSACSCINITLLLAPVMRLLNEINAKLPSPAAANELGENLMEGGRTPATRRQLTPIGGHCPCTNIKLIMAPFMQRLEEINAKIPSPAEAAEMEMGFSEYTMEGGKRQRRKTRRASKRKGTRRH